MKIDYKEMITILFDKIEGVRVEKVTAGSKFRLMGLVADVTEVNETLEKDVLEVVSHEAVLDADTEIDYAELAERVLATELTAPKEDLLENTQLVNEALGVLSCTLGKIADQLERHHSNEEYVRLYEQEKKRYLGSKTAKSARKTFDEWKEDQCYGTPSMEDIEDYRLEKVVRIFEKGVLTSRVEHVRRATRYPNELDFDLLPDDNPFKKTAYRYYSELRKMVDWQDGYLVVMPHRIGQHFYMSRHEENAKSHRTNLLKYMHKITLAQEERRKLLEAEATRKEDSENVLNYFAPAKNLKVLLTEEWFGMLTADEKRFTTKWLHGFVDALMASEWRDQIASDWTVADKRLGLKCMIIGLLKDAGVIRGSYNSIAKLLDMDNENPATLAKYMGMGKKQPYAEWIADYVKG